MSEACARRVLITAYERIRANAKAGKGAVLSAAEVRAMAQDCAIYDAIEAYHEDAEVAAQDESGER